MKIKIGGKILKIPEVKKANLWLKFRGLMFRNREKAEALLFKVKKPKAIHSWFVFFEFAALWIDNKNNIIKWKIILPFTSYEKPNKPFSKILEIPINKKYKTLVDKIIKTEKYK
ncbi:MAG: hypothetical protein WC533_02355 [Candidatus Pacearchaeota archaeon]